MPLFHGIGIFALASLAWFAERSVAIMAVNPHHRDNDIVAVWQSLSLKTGAGEAQSEATSA